MPCKPIAKRCKTIAENIPLGFDLTDFCVHRWSARTIYQAGETFRPPIGLETGYEYEVDAAGMSGETPPDFSQASVTDGSLTLTRQPISNASLARIISAVTWDGDGLEITDEAEVTTNGEQQVAAMAGGGTAGKHLPSVLVEFSDAQTREYSQEITVS